ncbi:MAG: DUF5110 domain-containing protein [Limnochordaceae bacterium]|nr:DUF5110 domain-containing protein [Limnochordaceae bacterium]
MPDVAKRANPGPFTPLPPGDGRSLLLEDPEGRRLEVAAWAPDLIRVRYVPPEKPPETLAWALARPEGEWPEDFPVRLEASPDGWTLSTPQLAVRVRRANGALAIDAQGHPEPIAADDPDLPVREGKPQLELFKQLSPSSMCLGLGEKTGWMDRRGRILQMWNTDVTPHLPTTDPLYQSIPFLVVYDRGRAWGLFIHNTYRTRFDLGATRPDRLGIHLDGGQLDYFVMAGPGLEQVVARFTELTGRMPLPPRWSLGFQQSRWGYQTADEVLQVARELRNRRIPCDVIYLDIDHMREYRVFTWDPVRFADPEGMMAKLRAQGLRVVTIVDPGIKIDPEYPVYSEALERQYYVRKKDGKPFEGVVWPGPTIFPDFLRQEVRRWWSQWHRELIGRGVSGIWNDMNEPANFRHPLPAGTLDLDAVHGPDLERPAEEQRPLLHAEAHNLYGLLMSKAAYEAQLALRPGVRPFVLSRAGFAGIQRYAAVWTGDNSSWWEHLAMMVPELLNMGLSGIAWAGADVGGFADHATAELVARWTQAGAFTPFFRNHAAIDARPQEVWRFGEEIERVCRDAIEWRYRLMPYLYTLFWEAASRGTPVMRPLLWHHPGDAEAERVQDQWLLGPHLLVAPVITPGARRRMVYLPAGEWVHLRQPVRITGPAYALVEAPLDQIPVFVAAGAPVPLAPLAQHTGELRQDDRVSLLLMAPAGDRGAFAWTWLYEDDGESLDYQQGAYARRRFDAEWSGSRAEGRLRLVLKAGPREGAWRPGRPYFEVVVQRPPGACRSVRWQGQPVPRSGQALAPAFQDEASAGPASGTAVGPLPVWDERAGSELVVRLPETAEPGVLEAEWDRAAQA